MGTSAEPGGVFDQDYDMENAVAAGLQADETGHWPSRVPTGPNEGMLLKSEKHPTFGLTTQGERDAGYILWRRNKDKQLFSFPMWKKPGSQYSEYKQ